MNKLLARIRVSITLLLLVVAGLMDRAAARAKGRDRGDVVQTVILIAGFCALAIAVVAWIGPVVYRYLSQIV